MMKNPFEQPGRWYKAALHVHTTGSDGQRSPREMAEWYRELGYDVLLLTDHFTATDSAGLSRPDFLVMTGMEFHPPVPGFPPSEGLHHFIAVGVPAGFDFSPATARNANASIRAVKAAGGVSFLAHPAWSRYRYDQYAYVKGYVAVEVFNSGARDIGRPDSERDWTQLLDAGRMLGAVATDDSHGAKAGTGCAWTWLKMRELTPSAVIEAIRTGCTYCSTGPVIEDFRIRDDGHIVLKCSPAKYVYFVVHNAPAGGVEFADRQAIRQVIRPLPSIWQRFRVVVEDQYGRKAWSNPLVVDGKTRARITRYHRTRQRENWKRVYPRAAKAKPSAWQPLDLHPHVNRALTGRGGGFAEGIYLRGMPTGSRRFHGVPFQILHPATPSEKTIIALPNSRWWNPRAGLPRTKSTAITIPVNQVFQALYILHTGAYIAEHNQVAEYQLVYSDGKVAKLPIFGAGGESPNHKLSSKVIRASRVQDWWWNHRQFEHAQARCLPIVPRTRSHEPWNAYSVEWVNPRPSVPVKELRLGADQNSPTMMVVLAATLLK